MLDVLKVWWVILTQVGPISGARHQAELWIRLFIIEALQEMGLFDYLKEPRNYGQIVAHFGLVDSRYTRDVLETLSSGQGNVLLREDDQYRRNSEQPLLDREQVKGRTPAKFHNMTMWEDMAQRIPGRMRQSPTDFVYQMAQDGRAVSSFDNTLNTEVYAMLRKAAFAYINARELRGKRLLDVACGSGHETVDIWMWLKGDVNLTAVDPVPELLALAQEHFEKEVSGHSRRGLAPLTEANRPTFRRMSAMDLDFPDNSFDAIFHSILLHWTPNPEHAIQEMARVLKPGGLAFGMQITKPLASPYIDLLTRAYENVYGYFWEQEFIRWYAKAGVDLSIATPAGIFKGRKRGS
jgi:ubiquinone/menaquinone biosynthesis C-methylase UbiE